MKKITGKLLKPGKVWVVQIEGKKGPHNAQIKMTAQYFNESDAVEGLEVDVELDDKNLVAKVTIPGKEQANPQIMERQAKKISHTRSPGKPRFGQAGGNSRPGIAPLTNRSDMAKAHPKVLGSPFHNPYTFIPFPEKSPDRTPVTYHSADEDPKSSRYSGVLKLKLTTLSPLLTSESSPAEGDRRNEEQASHKTYRALTIGNDVVLPATGVRGALRTLMTIITGGTLGYLNTDTILCHGRDLNLGPAGSSSGPEVPQHLHMAEVIEPGNSRKAGKIRIGTCYLVKLDDLQKVFHKITQPEIRKLDQKFDEKKTLWVELDSQNEIPLRVVASPQRPQGNFGRLRLSGRPVNFKNKSEAVFFSSHDDPTIELPAEFWKDYAERHKHGLRTNLKRGDLVWLMPHEPDLARVQTGADIQSLQWARWGRHGQKLEQLIDIHHPQVYPDYLREDRQVDTVTNLFGQVPTKPKSDVVSFAGRIIPDNLVFYDAKFRLEKNVVLAPLSQPHPGSIGFYRSATDPDKISVDDPLKGYKVYRTSKQRGSQAPWLFQNQGIYGNKAELLDARQKMNKTVELVPEGESGYLNLSFHALSVSELALLIQVTELPWRLGGGKPLGLGHCRVDIIGLLDELGQPLQVLDWELKRDQGSGAKSNESGNNAVERLTITGWQDLVARYQDRVQYWIASQTPVEKIAYPRSVDQNDFGKPRGGHIWFQRFAQPRMGDDKGKRKSGLSPVYIDGELKLTATAQGATLDSRDPMIAAQNLPNLDPFDPTADLLYGYDLFPLQSEVRQKPQRKVFMKFEPFDPAKHARDSDRSSGSHGNDREARRRQKDRD